MQQPFTGRSAITEEPCNMPSVGILSTVAQLCKKLFEKACSRLMSSMVIGIANVGCAVYHFLLMVCTNSISALHHF